MSNLLLVDSKEILRRRLLRLSDALLSEIETCRLGDLEEVPENLRDRVAKLQLHMTLDYGRPPKSVNDIQDLLFTVQYKLMRENPNYPRRNRVEEVGEQELRPPRPHWIREEAGGWPSLAFTSELDLNEQPELAPWVEAFVKKALDRWVYARYQLAKAFYQPEGMAKAKSDDDAARKNYQDLRLEAERRMILMSSLLVAPTPDGAGAVRHILANAKKKKMFRIRIQNAA